MNLTTAGAGSAGGRDGGTSVAPASRARAATVTDLFRDHHLELVRLAVRMVGDQATAEDVVQDAFERLHRGWRGLRQPASGLAYVRSSVLNGCRSVHRRAAVARKYAPRLAAQSQPPREAASAVDDSGTLAPALRSAVSRHTGVQPLVACPGLGRVENGTFTPLPSFPSFDDFPSVSGNPSAW